MSFHREVADAVGADGDAGVGDAQRQHERLLHRLAAEQDAQRRGIARRRRIDRQRYRAALELARPQQVRSEEHTSELQTLMRNSYAVFCLKKKKTNTLEKS